MNGGLQILAVPMKRERYEEIIRARAEEVERSRHYLAKKEGTDMGLAPGGLMRQSIYKDPHGLEAWETSLHSRCYVHVLNSLQYAAVTGKRPPTEPLSADVYTKAGLPWFDYYDADLKALAGSTTLAALDSVAAKGIKKGETPLASNDPVMLDDVILLGPTQAAPVRERGW